MGPELYKKYLSQPVGSNPVSSVSPWPLLQLLPLRSSCPGFPLRTIWWNKPFPPQVAFDHSNREPICSSTGHSVTSYGHGETGHCRGFYRTEKAITREPVIKHRRAQHFCVSYESQSGCGSLKSMFCNWLNEADTHIPSHELALCVACMYLDVHVLPWVQRSKDNLKVISLLSRGTQIELWSAGLV